jgi:hypothetical protein
VPAVFITISSNNITVSSNLITENFKLLSYFLQIAITISSNFHHRNFKWGSIKKRGKHRAVFPRIGGHSM